jgi:membrane-associated PAP2 superfamily phosphatase
MSRSKVNYAIWIPLAVLAIGTLVAWLTDIDRDLASVFYDRTRGGWFSGQYWPFAMAYRYGEILGFLPVLVALVVLIASIWVIRLRKWRRASVFLIAVLALGPGLAVNGILKEYWGRPRPRQVTYFGGQKGYTYQKPWVIGQRGDGRTSFPSGHVAMGFFFMSPYFIYLARRRRTALLWFWGGAAYGIFIGIARVVQGAHWASDVLWAFGVVYLVSYALARLLKLDRMEEQCTTPAPNSQS